MEAVDCVVIGAGVIGLAIARALAVGGREVLVLERNERHGMETSSRNSEVIHAGIYYPADTLKAQLCIRGRGLLYDYCGRRGIAHRQCGKLIVATQPAQEDALAKLQRAGAANGVDDLQLLDRDAAMRFEPALRCTAALLSPSTGIVDSHEYMVALLADAEDRGARLVVRTEVDCLEPTARGFELRIGGERQSSLQAQWVINAAGLSAGIVASRIPGFPQQWLPRIRYAKGSYFSLSGRAPFARLIYPLPEPGGLGIHLTLDMAGRARFGPDVEWTESPDYTVDPRRAAAFVPGIQAFWPALRLEQLTPAYAGVRPKLSGPGEPPADFCIEGPSRHGIRGLVNLFGIESPGLTASLAIAERVLQIMGEG